MWKVEIDKLREPGKSNESSSVLSVDFRNGRSDRLQAILLQGQIMTPFENGTFHLKWYTIYEPFESVNGVCGSIQFAPWDRTNGVGFA